LGSWCPSLQKLPKVPVAPVEGGATTLRTIEALPVPEVLAAVRVTVLVPVEVAVPLIRPLPALDR